MGGSYPFVMTIRGRKMAKVNKIAIWLILIGIVLFFTGFSSLELLLLVLPGFALSVVGCGMLWWNDTGKPLFDADRGNSFGGAGFYSGRSSEGEDEEEDDSGE